MSDEWNESFCRDCGWLDCECPTPTQAHATTEPDGDADE